jgi:hypothetical protein
MIHKVEVQEHNQTRVFDDSGRMMCQFRPTAASFRQGRWMKPSAGSTCSMTINNSTGIYDLNSGTSKGWA